MPMPMPMPEATANEYTVTYFPGYYVLAFRLLIKAGKYINLHINHTDEAGKGLK